MSDGNRPLVVVDTDGATAGLVRLDVIAGALAVGNGTDAQAEAAHAPAEVPDLPAAGDAEP
jgi:hypothetical protein